MTGVICGTGSCVPVHTLDNHDIAKLVDTSDEWIRERTGVVRRHIIEKETYGIYGGRSREKSAGGCPDRGGRGGYDSCFYHIVGCGLALCGM